MKKIHLLRHAKSDWGDDLLADIDRSLNTRGITVALYMASQLHQAGCPFVHVFCSPAARAQSTIELISKQLPTINFQWQTDEALYTFDSRRLHEWFRSLDESISECLIIGHNPALTNFCNQLSNSEIQNIPTCGYIQLVASRACSWQEVSETPFELTTFLKPKDLMQ
ncbi:MAG: phosphoglycerate mutase family protein [Methylophilaceae bacterium]